MFLSFDSHLLFALIPLSILLVFLISWVSSAKKPHKNPPPSPPKLPIIGNLFQLGSRPHSYFHDLAQKYGPLMQVHLGSVPVLVASTAETAQQIMKNHDLDFCNRPNTSITHLLTFGSKDIAFAPYGDYWRHIKSISMLQLLSTKRVQSFRQVREEETGAIINMINKSSDSLVDISELLATLTSNIVCRVTLGKTCPGFKFKEMLRKLTHLLGVFSVGNYIPCLKWLGRLWGLERTAIEFAPEFNEFLEGVLEDHLSKRASGDVHDDDEDDKPQDLVDILLDAQSENGATGSLHRDTVKAVIMDVFSAGIETTSTSMEWAICELIRHPETMKRLQQEVTEVAQGRSRICEDDIDHMPYLRAVIKEAFRLHPPAPLLIPRVAIKDVKLMGYDIAAGTHVLINAWSIGRDYSLWDEPYKFKPERFLNNPIDYKGLHYELLPFGAGRRGCPGAQFSVYIDRLAIANLVYKYDLVPEKEVDMSETMGIVVHRKFPLMVKAIPRF